MKRIITLLSASAVMLSAASCSKVEQSTLSSETLPMKITVTGHVRFIANDNGGSQMDPEPVNSGTVVNVMYGVPDAEGKTAFALKSVETDMSGYFECEIGCPAGKTMSVKVNSSYIGYSYTRDKDGDYTESETAFFSELDKTSPGGKTIYFSLDLTPSAHLSEDGMTQPK